MAVRKCTQAETANGGDLGIVVTWAGLVNGDTGDLFDMTGFVPLSMQVEGTFGAGGSMALEGSNDGVNQRGLHSSGLTAIAVTAAGIVPVSDTTRYVSPHATAGDGTTSLTVSLYLRKANAR